MFDYDAIIIGGGPAGLTAGLYLGRAKRRVVLLEKDVVGGKIVNLELIENYPGFSESIPGARLASEMVTQATDSGLQIEHQEVVDIENYSSCKSVTCADGTTYVTSVVIIGGGSKPKKLGVSGEEAFMEKGVFYCGFCDGGQFADGVVAVCGGGDAGITEALYMTKIASKVILLEMLPSITASAILQERARANPKLKIRCGVTTKTILGDSRVEAIEFLDQKSQKIETLKVDGVLVCVGVLPNTAYLKDVPLDDRGQIIVNTKMETDVPYVLACGDIKSNSPGQVATAVGDGAAAGISAIKLLNDLA